MGFNLIPEAVAIYKKQNPHVNINLQTMHNDEVQQALLEHQIDFALMFSPPPLPGVSQQTICESQLVMMYPVDFFPHKPTSITLKQLENHEVIGIWDSGPLGDLIWSRLAEDDIAVNTNIKVQTYFLAARLVAQEMGICVIDQYTARGNMSGNVAIATIEPTLHFNLKALYIEDKALSQTAINFLQIINQISEQ